MLWKFLLLGLALLGAQWAAITWMMALETMKKMKKLILLAGFLVGLVPLSASAYIGDLRKQAAAYWSGAKMKDLGHGYMYWRPGKWCIFENFNPETERSYCFTYIKQGEPITAQEIDSLLKANLPQVKGWTIIAANNRPTYKDATVEVSGDGKYFIEIATSTLTFATAEGFLINLKAEQDAEKALVALYQ